MGRRLVGRRDVLQRHLSRVPRRVRLPSRSPSPEQRPPSYAQIVRSRIMKSPATCLFTSPGVYACGASAIIHPFFFLLSPLERAAIGFAARRGAATMGATPWGTRQHPTLHKPQRAATPSRPFIVKPPDPRRSHPGSEPVLRNTARESYCEAPVPVLTGPPAL
jgi:hypothetical protein